MSKLKRKILKTNEKNDSLLNAINAPSGCEISLIYTGATKYYLSCQGEGAISFCEVLIGQWRFIPPVTRRLIMHLVEEEFRSYEEIESRKEHLRDFGYNIQPLGKPENIISWENLRKIWKEI